jgi:hypothetical protein
MKPGGCPLLSGNVAFFCTGGQLTPQTGPWARESDSTLDSS